jgi:hypothetical protein
MLRNLAFVVGYAVIQVLSTTASVWAADFGTAEEAKAMLERAVAAVKEDKAKALDMFNNGEGGFKDRDLYVFCANASDGIITAQPYMNKGKQLRDIEGKHGAPFGQEIVQTATEGTIKEVTYWWPRPGSDKPLAKTTFYTKAGDQICAVGYYKINAPELTERDSYIIAQALYEFIRLEQSKPMAERRGLDERDAKAILHELFDNELQLLVRSDEAAGLTPPDCKRRVTIGG